MGEINNNLWAPWRMKYIAGLADDDDGDCFLCRYRDTPADDVPNRVLWRSERTLTLLNRFPYTSGHLLIAPTVHCGSPEETPDDVWVEAILRVRDAVRVLQKALGPEGFNLGMNLARCAGAGLPDHVHWHVVPRWSGDTNFMTVTGETRVIPEDPDATYRNLLAAAAALGLPSVGEQ